MRGLIIRHLLMPGRLEDTASIMRWIAALSPDAYVNVMDQYYPAWKAETNARYADINRRVSGAEVAPAFALARAAGLWRRDERWREVTPLRRFLLTLVE